MMKWLVIGVGDITTKRVLPAIEEEERSDLVGIVTRNPAKAEPYGVPGFTDLREAISKTRPDAVYVASPVFMHAPQTMVSLREGCHVLCEKTNGHELCRGRIDGGHSRSHRTYAGRRILQADLPQGSPRHGSYSRGCNWAAGARLCLVPRMVHRRERFPCLAFGPRQGRRRPSLRYRLAPDRPVELHFRTAGSRTGAAFECREQDARGRFRHRLD